MGGFSPFYKRLLGITDNDTPDRVEDDNSAGRRGVTPQSDTAPNDPGFYAGATHPVNLPASTLPLERTIARDSADYNRLVAPPPPMTLMQRLQRAATMGGAAALGETQPEVKARQQERESLGTRIGANERELANVGLGENRITAQAQMLAQRMAEQERLRQMTNDAAMDRTSMTQASEDRRAQATLGQRIAEYQEPSKPEARVMGSRTKQYDPVTRTWKDVGAKPDSPTNSPSPERTGKIQDLYVGRLDKIAGPIQQRMGRLDGALQVLGQGTAASDALAAPEVLSAVVGGIGTGLRMNEAEIARIVGGRDAWEGLKARLQQVTPGSGQSLTPVQRQQLTQIVQLIQSRAQAINSIIDQAREQLIMANDEPSVRQIYANAYAKINQTLGGGGGAGGAVVTLDQLKQQRRSKEPF